MVFMTSDKGFMSHTYCGVYALILYYWRNQYGFVQRYTINDYMVLIVPSPRATRRFIRIMLIIIIMVIIKRGEAKFIDETGKWVLLYGRRKTGKTFLVKNFVKSDKYFFIKRDRTIINGKEIGYEAFLELVKECLKNGQTVAIDEFHRLGDDFLDVLHSLGGKGKLILLSSTLHLSKKILSSRSPLLGLVAEVPLGLIPLDLAFKEISKLGFRKKEALELSVFCREPTVIDYIRAGKGARDIIAEVMLATRHTVPALVGEIFIEEDRQISGIYEGILRAVSVGKNRAGEIANHLFSKKLIQKESSTMIQQYLKNLIDFGILKRVFIFNKREYVYDLISPLMRLYFYSDEKYNFGEEANAEKAKRILSELIPRLVESSIREHLAHKFGLQEAIISDKDNEIDICLLRFKKPHIVGEVKWKDVGTKEITRIQEKLEKIDAKRKVLFIPDKKGIKSGLEILDADDML